MHSLKILPPESDLCQWPRIRRLRIPPRPFTFARKNEFWYLMESVRYCCPIETKIDMARQYFVKFPNTNLYENPFSRSRVINAFRRTDNAILIGALQGCERTSLVARH
jgi:hypothetical protein